jgi:hypothetical protein
MSIVRRIALLLAALSLASVAFGAEQPADAGRWQAHSQRLHYMGFTTIYSCDGLVSKLQILLKASGARDGAKVLGSGCSQIGGGPDRFAAAKLEFQSFVPALATEEGAAPARWRKVHLVDGRPFDLAPGDCELLEQFRDEVLRKSFTVRNLVDRLHCVPNQVPRSFSLDFEVLSPAASDERARK